MQNGLNGQFLSQLPQFQQNVTGFNQFNQLSSTNFQQLATSAAGAFQAPNTQQPSANDMVMTGKCAMHSNWVAITHLHRKLLIRIVYVWPGQNIQFAPQQQPISVSVAQTMPTSQIIAVQSQPQMMPTTIPTPEPMRNPTPITLIPQVQFDHTHYRDRTTFQSNAGPLTHTNAMQNTTVIVPEPPKSQVLAQPIIQPHTSTIPPNELVKQPASTPMSSAIANAPIAKPAKKPKKSKAKKEPNQAMTMVSVSQPLDMLSSHSAPKVNIATLRWAKQRKIDRRNHSVIFPFS